MEIIFEIVPKKVGRKWAEAQKKWAFCNFGKEVKMKKL